jgi:hypothetical protein
MTHAEQIAEVDRITSRQIARLLNHLGGIAPVLEASIKRSYRFYAEDIKVNVLGMERPEEDDERGNR